MTQIQKKIDIYIKDAGKTEITVSDNGSGALRKVNLRRQLLDIQHQRLINLLNKIKTMGFRGEALSSIVSVSDTTIRANCNNDLDGHEINLISWKFNLFKTSKSEEGLFCFSKNLFYSTPARLKFLKSASYETLLIKRLIQKFAIIHDDKRV